MSSQFFTLLASVSVFICVQFEMSYAVLTLFSPLMCLPSLTFLTHV